MNTLARANVRAYLRRYVAIIIAVGMGVAFLAAVLNFTSSTKESLKAAQGQMISKADVVLEPGSGGASFSEDARPTSDKIQQVLDDSGSVEDQAEVQTSMAFMERSQGKQPITLKVYAVKGAQDLLGFKRTSGDAPGQDSVGISQDLKEDASLSTNDELTLSNDLASPGSNRSDEHVKSTKLDISSIYQESVQIDDMGMPVVVMDSKTAEDLDLMQSTSAYLLKTTSGTDHDALVKELNQGLKDAGLSGWEAKTPQASVDEAMQTISGGVDLVGVGLGAFVALAVIVCILVTANTFSVVLAQRTRELALLRTIGARTKQLKRMVLAEGLWVGLIGGVIGLAVGIGLMAGLGLILGKAMGLKTYTFAMNWWSIPAGLILAVGMTLLAAIRPAAAASRLSPIAALQPQHTVTVASRKGAVRIILSLLLILAGGALIYTGLEGPGISTGLAYGAEFVMVFLGSVLGFLGVMFLATFLIPLAVSAVGRIFAHTPATRLSRLNALRHPARTGAVGTSLLIGVTLVATVLTGVASLSATKDKVFDQTFPMDVTVQPRQGEVTDSQVNQIKRVAGVESTTEVHKLKEEASDSKDQKVCDVYAGDAEALETVLPKTGKVPGTDEIAISGAGGSANTVKIGSTELKRENDASGTELPCFITTEAAQAHNLDIDSSEGTTQIWITTTDDFDALNGVENISKAAGVNASEVEAPVMIRAAIDQAVLTFTFVMMGLLGVAVLIALIGVSNTLSLSILERTRENALLRAVGLTRRQMRSMLFLEALLIAGVSGLIGILLGVGFGTAGAQAMLSQAPAATLSIPWIPLLILWGVTAGVSVLAGILPSRRASNASPVEGLAEE